jgi:DNA mismatch repair protein MutL
MIDVNIHPTKTEINFQNNQLLYAILRSAVKQAIGKFNITPTIDFDVEQSLDLRNPEKGKPIKNPFAREYKGFNPFDNVPGKRSSKTLNSGWEKIYEGISHPEERNETSLPVSNESEQIQFLSQLKGKFIISSIKSGMMIIDQQRAHQRILYEHFMKRLENQKQVSQQELFPQNVTFSSSDAEIIKELLPDLEILGFSINHLGKNTFIINGTPTDLSHHSLQELLEGFLETYKRNLIDLNLEKRANLARSMAVRMAIKQGKNMQKEEMENLINELFSCKSPELSPDGKKTLIVLPLEQIDQMFNN